MQSTGAHMQTTSMAMSKTSSGGGAMPKTTNGGGAMPKTTKGYYTTGLRGTTAGRHMGSTKDGTHEPKRTTTTTLAPKSTGDDPTRKPSDKARSSAIRTSGASTTGRSEHVKIVQMVELSFDKATCEANKKELGAAWRKSVG